MKRRVIGCVADLYATTPENVNDVVVDVDGHVYANPMVYFLFHGLRDAKILRHLLSCGASVTSQDISWIVESHRLHMFLESGLDPNIHVKDDVPLFSWVSANPKRLSLLLQYGARIPSDVWQRALPLECQTLVRKTLERQQRCRRTLAVLMWVAPRELRPWYRQMCKDIWRLLRRDEKWN